MTGTPGKICECNLAKSYEISVGDPKTPQVLKLPPSTKAYFSNDEIVLIRPEVDLNVDGRTLSKNKLYSVNKGAPQEVDLDSLPDCDDQRKPSKEDIDFTFKKYGFSKDDFESIEAHHACSHSMPIKYYDGEAQKSIQGRLKKNVKTKDFQIPKGAYISFCNGKLESISNSLLTREVLFWGQRCDAGVTADHRLGEKEPQRYMCKLLNPIKLHESPLPAETGITFNRKEIECFGRNLEGKLPKIEGGEEGDDRFWFENGQLKSGRVCPSDLEPEPSL